MVIRPKIRRRSLSQDVANEIRNMIHRGELGGGQKLTQEELAQTLGVSTMPVREALVSLINEGFVRTTPSRTYEVVQVKREDILDIFWLHASIAGELAYRACRGNDPAFITALENIQDRFVDAVQRHDTHSMDITNWEFHRLINTYADSPRLVTILKGILKFIPSEFYSQIPEWQNIAVSDHAGLVQAMQLGNVESAREVAVNHVNEAGQILIQHFSDAGYWEQP